MPHVDEVNNICTHLLWISNNTTQYQKLEDVDVNKGLKIELKKEQLMIIQLKEENRKHKELDWEHATKLAGDMSEIKGKIKNAKKTIKRSLTTRRQLINMKRKNTTLQVDNRTMKE